MTAGRLSAYCQSRARQRSGMWTLGNRRAFALGVGAAVVMAGWVEVVVVVMAASAGCWAVEMAVVARGAEVGLAAAVREREMDEVVDKATAMVKAEEMLVVWVMVVARERQHEAGLPSVRLYYYYWLLVRPARPRSPS